MWLILLLTCLGLTRLSVAAPASDQASVPVQPVVQHHRLGPVELTLQADRQTMGLADRLHVTLAVEAPVEMSVTLPELADRIGPFLVLHQTPSAPQPTVPQRQRWQRDYTLAAENVGDQTLPALTVSFQDAKAAQDAVPQSLHTEPLTITVTTVLPDDADVTAPKDVAPPVTLRRHGVAAWVWIVLVVVLGLAGLGAVWYGYRRTRRVAPVAPQPAHVLALEALHRLQRQDLIAQQRIEAYYVRLSTILRRYVEWRFHLRAPEQTTEEFLAASLATGGFIATHRELLGTFLQHCDLVKFAQYQPSPTDMQQAWNSARDFVQQTADPQVVVASRGEVL